MSPPHIFVKKIMEFNLEWEERNLIHHSDHTMLILFDLIYNKVGRLDDSNPQVRHLINQDLVHLSGRGHIISPRGRNYYNKRIREMKKESKSSQTITVHGDGVVQTGDGTVNYQKSQTPEPNKSPKANNWQKAGVIIALISLCITIILKFKGII